MPQNSALSTKNSSLESSSGVLLLGDPVVEKKKKEVPVIIEKPKIELPCENKSKWDDSSSSSAEGSNQ